MGCSGGGQNTVVQQSQPPQFVQDNLQNLGNAATSLAGQGIQQWTGPTQAGFTPAQLQAFGTIDNMQGMGQQYVNAAMNALGGQTSVAVDTQPWMQQANDAWKDVHGTNINGGITGFVNQMGGINLPGAVSPYTGKAMGTDFTGGISPFTSAAVSSLDPNNISRYMSPYTNNVVNATQAQFNNQNEQARQGMIGNAISSGAWGGDRAGVAQAILANQQQLAQAPVIAGLFNSGWTQAGDLAAKQAGMNLGAGQLTSQALGQQANTALSAGQQTLAANQGQADIYKNQAALTSDALAKDAQAKIAAAQGFSGLTAQQAAINQMDNQNALQTAFAMGQLGNSAQNMALQGANAQLQTGGLQQQLAQQQLNTDIGQFMQQQAYPYQQLNWLNGIYTGQAGAAGGTGTTTSPAPSMLSQIGGLGLTGLGLYNSGALSGLGGLFGSAAAPTAATTASMLAGSYLAPNIGLGAFGLLAGGVKKGGVVKHRADGGVVPNPSGVLFGHTSDYVPAPRITNAGAAPFVSTPRPNGMYLTPQVGQGLFSTPSANVNAMQGGPTGLGASYNPLPRNIPWTDNRTLTLPSKVLSALKIGDGADEKKTEPTTPTGPSTTPWGNPDSTLWDSGVNFNHARGGIIARRAVGGDLDTEDDGLPYRAPLVDWRRTAITPHIEEAAKTYNLDPQFFGRTLMQESGPYAQKGVVPTFADTGYYGFGQISAPTAKDMGFDVARLESDPRYSVDAAARVLQAKLKAYGGDKRMAYLAYNGANMDNPSPLALANWRNVSSDLPTDEDRRPIGGDPVVIGGAANDDGRKGGNARSLPSPAPIPSYLDRDNPFYKQMVNPTIDPWMSVAKAGMAMMAGRSPFALANIGEGALAGLNDYTARKQQAVNNAAKGFNADRQAMQLLEQAERWRSEFGLNQEKAAEAEAHNREGERLKQMEIERYLAMFGGPERWKYEQWRRSSAGQNPDGSPKDYGQYLIETAPGKVVEGQLINPRTGESKAPGAAQQGTKTPAQQLAEETGPFSDVPAGVADEYVRRANPSAAKIAFKEEQKLADDLNKKVEAAQASSAELEALRATVNKPDFNTDAATPMKEKIASTLYAGAKVAGASDEEAKATAQKWTGINLTDQSIFNKVTTQGGLQNAKNLEGAREAYASILIALKAWPSASNTTESNRVLVDLLDAPNRWTMNKAQYREEYMKRNNLNPIGFNAWYNKNHPVDEFVSQVIPYKMPEGVNAKNADSKLKMNTFYQLPNGTRAKYIGNGQFETE